MKILETSVGLSSNDVLAMVLPASSVSCKDAIGCVIKICGYVYYSPEKDAEDDYALLSFIDEERQVYVTNSKSFQKDFNNIISLAASLEIDCPEIVISHGTSKAGRTFLYCRISYTKSN